MVPDIECNTIRTNLGWSDDDVINGYHAHGECEQFHSEIKTDMDVERLPSGKFETNELVLESFSQNETSGQKASNPNRDQ